MNYWEKTKLSFDLLIFRSLVESIEERGFIKRKFLAGSGVNFHEMPPWNTHKMNGTFYPSRSGWPSATKAIDISCFLSSLVQLFRTVLRLNCKPGAPVKNTRGRDRKASAWCSLFKWSAKRESWITSFRHLCFRLVSHTGFVPRQKCVTAAEKRLLRYDTTFCIRHTVL